MIYLDLYPSLCFLLNLWTMSFWVFLLLDFILSLISSSMLFHKLLLLFFLSALLYYDIHVNFRLRKVMYLYCPHKYLTETPFILLTYMLSLAYILICSKPMKMISFMKMFVSFTKIFTTLMLCDLVSQVSHLRVTFFLPRVHNPKFWVKTP